MQAPNLNPFLSGMARAVWMVYATVGRVMSTSEMMESNYMNEGRDAIRNAMKELHRQGYINIERTNDITTGRWTTTLSFTEVGRNYVDQFNWNYQPVPPRPEFPTLGEPGNVNTIMINSNSRLEVLRTSNLSDAQGALKVKEAEMAWPMLDGEEAPKKKVRHVLETEDDSGAIGKVVDKREMRRIKYKKTTFETTPEYMRRFERPESEWTTEDIIAEFYDGVRKVANGAPAQVNGKSLRSIMNKWIGEGVPRTAVLEGVRRFFADPRNFHDVGVGLPIWRRFVSYYPTVHGLAAKSETEYVDDDFLAHQEKMLKLLGGE